MLSFVAFETYLKSTIDLRPITSGLLANAKPDLRQWAAKLSMQPDSEQFTALEKLLSRLIVAQMSDADRIKWIEHVLPSVKRLIGQLRQHYIYEVSALSDEQQRYANQVKSLGYMLALIYENIIQRQPNAKPKPSKNPLKKLRLRRAEHNHELSFALAGGIHVYLNLLIEDSLCYHRSELLYWKKLNEYYRKVVALGHQSKPLPNFFAEHGAQNVEDLYRQACLHNLLGLCSYCRQDIIGMHKLLPIWAKQIVLTKTPKPQHRLFVDLDSNRPPQHLTPQTPINPFEEGRNCVFLDLVFLERHLNHLTALPKNAQTLNQMRLAKMAQHTLASHTGQQRWQICSEKAQLISGFDSIHFYMAGGRSLSSVIEQKHLKSDFLPDYDALPKSPRPQQHLTVQLIHASNIGCRFRLYQTPKGAPDDLNTPPHKLQDLCLFALQVHHNKAQNADKDNANKWQIGLVRWSERQGDMLEVGGHFIGFSATACGVRLATKDNRSQAFVPALLLAGNDKLGTKTTLLLPKQHFHMNDKIILRIGDAQTLLKLHHVLISSDDFEQYDILKTQ